MALGVLQPRKKQKSGGILGGIGSLLGAGIGFAAGGPAGAGVGLTIGGQVAGATDVLGAQPGQRAIESIPTADSAISRKLQAQNGNVLQQLRESALALVQLPPELRKEFATPILQAFQLERQRTR